MKYINPYDAQVRATKQKFLISHLYSNSSMSDRSKSPQRINTARSNASSHSSGTYKSSVDRFSYRGRRSNLVSARSNYSSLTGLSTLSNTSPLALSYRSAVFAYLNPKYLGDARSVTSAGDSVADGYHPNDFGDDGKSGRSKATAFSKALSGASGPAKSILSNAKTPTIVVQGADKKNGENAHTRFMPVATEGRSQQRPQTIDSNKLSVQRPTSKYSTHSNAQGTRETPQKNLLNVRDKTNGNTKQLQSNNPSSRNYSNPPLQSVNGNR